MIDWGYWDKLIAKKKTFANDNEANAHKMVYADYDDEIHLKFSFNFSHFEIAPHYIECF